MALHGYEEKVFLEALRAEVRLFFENPEPTATSTTFLVDNRPMSKENEFTDLAKFIKKQNEELYKLNKIKEKQE